MAKDSAKDASKKRKRDGTKSPSPLAEPESSKVTKSKSDKKEKKDKSEKKEKKDKSEKKEKKEKKEKSKKKDDDEENVGDTSMVDVDDAAEEVKMEVDTEGAPLVPLGALVPFAKPLAEGKLHKKVLKTTKKAAKTKALKRGVKEVVKALRKSPNHAANASSKPDAKTLPLLILAADISPPDVISHLPVLAEDHGIPYIFVTSRAELGAAGATKRPTSVVMITPESAGKKKGGKKDKKDGEDGKDKGLDKIKEEEEEFRSSYKDLVKDVMGVTKALAV
ncbi:hypothetical protein H072_837 [Dactylellina haptotyla CBS 200.50]|uniref:H/ACA ribonucleoprotein complex subunit 2 n=1 Tax=Dactylellina haptotyla (strain CBS 200.50) TaxID=1284197 RepID=S8AW61_DACHA|nr:hypothetical protein H072_837 [Dactylellina haptotyla CBS 200.50]